MLPPPPPAKATFSIPYPRFQAENAANPDEVNSNFAAIENVIGPNTYSTSTYITTDATITDNLRALDARMRTSANLIANLSDPITEIQADRVTPVSNGWVSDLQVIKFGPSADSAIWFSFRNLRTGYDYKLRLEGCMDSADASKQISMNIEYYVVAASGDVTPAAATGTGEDEISVPSTAETKITHTGKNLVIPYAHLTSANEQILVKLWRDVDGTASNHTGNFCLTNLYLTQADPAP